MKKLRKVSWVNEARLESDEDDHDEYLEQDMLSLINDEMKSLNERLANKVKDKIKYKMSEEVFELIGGILKKNNSTSYPKVKKAYSQPCLIMGLVFCFLSLLYICNNWLI